MCKGPGGQTVWGLYSRKCGHETKTVSKYHLIFNKTCELIYIFLLKNKKNALFCVVFSRFHSVELGSKWSDSSQYLIGNPLLFEKGLISTL